MNCKSFRVGMVLSIVIASPSSASACLWDYDTLKQERARFPDTLEIITGKFLRHSKEFYEWRIQDRLKRIAADPKNPALHDDLAVAYEKTGQNPKAIETMLKVEEFAPGRYETYSNLGTFYFLGGDLKKGLEYVDKALAINPDAHFGREKYQKYLTEYVLEQCKDGKIVLPLSRSELFPEGAAGTFSLILGHKTLPEVPHVLSKSDYQSAVKGVLGMMRFAYHDSPILLEILGDLLVGRADAYPEIDAKRLAARAYLQAAQNANDATSMAAYRKLAEKSLMMQTKHENTQDQINLGAIEKEFQLEQADAQAWYRQLHENEVRWIRDGLDPESEFDKLYTEEPRVPGEIGRDDTFPPGPHDTTLRNATVIGIVGMSLLAFAIFVLTWRRFHRSKQAYPQDPNP